jgi:hypothetical protein
MNRIIQCSRNIVAFQLLAVTMLLVFVSLSINSFAQPDPQCVYRDLSPPYDLIQYDCDRYQSKGDIDSVTPQIKIVKPEHGDKIDCSKLTDSNGNGIKELPITIVVSPDDVYTVDFSAASNAGTQYAMLPQEDGLGHAHAYIAPEITVAKDAGGNITSVTFVGQQNRSDLVGGFCVFQFPVLQTLTYQVLTVNCDLQQVGQPISFGSNYRVIVDTTENSHGPRIKHHPRAVPPGDQVIIQFKKVNDC